MDDLSKLSSVERRLDLRWETQLDEKGLTGKHFNWHEEERDRLSRIARQGQVSWRRDSSVNWQDETATDQIGISASIAMAEARFKDLCAGSRNAWLKSGAAYEAFDSEVERIAHHVSLKVVSIWTGRSEAHDAWYERACRPKIEENLASLVKEEIKWGRAMELRRLERNEASNGRNSLRHEALVKDATNGWAQTDFRNHERSMEDLSASAASDPPSISKEVLRKHTLQWNQLKAKRGFAGDHLKWYLSTDRRHQLARPNHTLASPPTRNLDEVHYYVDGKEVDWSTWKQDQEAQWIIRQNSQSNIDKIGIAASISLSLERFDQIAADYYSFWTQNDGDSSTFRRWAVEIGSLVCDEMASVWTGEYHSAWFWRACYAPVRAALLPAIEKWCSQAETFEIRCLQKSIEIRIGGDSDIPSDNSTQFGPNPSGRAGQDVLSDATR